MEKTRLEQLQEFYDQDPTDPFNIYALALEYQKFDIDKAEELFSKLLKEQPDYVPTYYHAAKLYEELDETERAKEVYVAGIEKSKEKQEHHAHKELQNAYNMLLDEEEDW